MGGEAIEKRWDPRREAELIEIWESEGLYRSSTYGGDKDLVVIDTPPPYTSGKWHVGGAAHYAQIDMVARYLRMKGYRVIAPWYADRNGLPVEILVERQTGINPHEVAKTPDGRERFLSICKEKLDEVERDLVRVWKRLGCSFEYWENGTDSPEYRRLTQTTFIEMWRKGLIYEAERPVYWCPRCMTTLAEAEIEYAEKPADLYHIRIELTNGQRITIATTRPELLGAMMVLAYNPSDPRYQGLEGVRGRVPIYGYEVPVIAHPEVDPSFGTGIEMVCSYGDTRDLRILRELGLIDKARILIDKDGRMNELSGELKGLTISEARGKMAGILRSLGILEGVERLGPRRAPTCWRCGTPVEIINSRELFLKQLEFADKLIDVSSGVDFKPESHRQKLVDWIRSLRIDWPISKTRYYATEIPLWRCRSCGSYLVPEPGKYYRPWRDPPPFERCPVCGAGWESLEGDKRVFDTWFDSSISPLYVSGYMRDEKLFSQAMGSILRPQGYEIIRTWLYYTILRVYLLLGAPAFRWVRISGMGLDEKGEAMHKSKGNVVDPEPLLERYGADAFRFWAAGAAKLGYDYRFSENMIRTGSLFATKLINISRFISRFPDPSEGYVLRAIDRALLSRLAETIERVDKAYSEFDVYEPIHAIYDFTWNIFADHYIEAIKTRAYNNGKSYSDDEQRGAWYTLHRALEAILRILAPIMPFTTDHIWRTIKGRSVHLERFPEEHLGWRQWSQEPLNLMIKINSAVWKYKKERNMRLSEKLDATLYIDNQNAKDIEKEIRDLHRVSEIVIGRPREGAEEIAENMWILKQSADI